MKVLLINKNHFIVGGADSVYLNTGQLLISKEIDVVYFSTKNNKNIFYNKEHYFAEEVITRKTTIFKKFFNFFKYLYNFDNIKKLSNLVIIEKPDIAHLHLFYGTLSPSILKVLKKYKIPTVITLHDYRLLCPSNAMLDINNNICEKCASSSNYNCLLLKCSNNNYIQSLILTIEAYIRKYFLIHFNYITHYIFVSKFSLNKHVFYDSRYISNSSQLYNFYESKLNPNFIKGDYFFYYGRLSNEKGLLTLIECFKISNKKLIIVGSGPLSDFINNVTKQWLNIKYLGFKFGTELENLILKSSFVIVPSEWYENNPMTIIEGYSYGKPAIGSNIGGIPELVNNNYNGFIFDFGNADELAKCIQISENVSNEEYQILAKNARNFAEINCAPEVHYNALINIYNDSILNY
jgi:glycosyltransferase involved in cell wall biosynthesis